jgi:hypothetical protein
MGIEIGFDVARFDLRYQIKRQWTPNYRLISAEAPPALPNPFTTPAGPFLMPG